MSAFDFDLLRRHRALIVTVSLGLVAAGLMALARLGSGIYPELQFPRIVVIVRLGDLPPAQFQNEVVRPLEQSLATVLGVRRLRSRVIQGAAEIALQFSDDADLARGQQLVESAIARSRSELPPETEIESERVTPADFPILSLNLTGGTSTARREAADLLIVPALSRVPGVARVDVVGGDPREVEVELDPARLAALRLRPSEVVAAVSSGLVRSAVGRLDRDHQRVAVVATGADSLEALRRLPIAVSEGQTVTLQQAARLFEAAPDRTLGVHSDRGDAVQVTVARIPGASAPEVVQAVEQVVAGLTLPDGITLTKAYDQGALIHESILGVRDAILIGIALTVGVLGLFLRDPRAGLLAALSVPFALMVGFLPLYLFHESLNLMSLGGMAIAIGLVIDDAVVVIEAVVRELERGKTPREATAAALEEITAPVVGTTLTTVIVLLPLAFLAGLTGRFFSSLAITLGSAVLASLWYALLLLPLLAARWLKPVPPAPPKARSARRYLLVLRSMIGRPVVAIALLVAMVSIGLISFRAVPSGFLPEMDEGAFVLDYFLPAGSSLEATEKAALQIESVLRETPGVQAWTRRTGAELGPMTATQVNSGDIAVLLAPRHEREEAEEIIDRVRQRLESQLPGVRVEFMQILEDVINDLSGAPRPIEVKILGPEQRRLATLAEEAEKRLDGVPHLTDYYRGVEDPAPILRLQLDPVASKRVGLSADQLAAELGTIGKGTIAGELPRWDRLIPVRVRYPDAIRFDPTALMASPLAVEGAAVPLGSMIAAHWEQAPSTLLRENLSQAALATAEVEGDDIGTAAREVRERLADFKLPVGYRLELGGRIASQHEAFLQLSAVLALGGLAVLAVLIAQFRNLRAALLVLLLVVPAVGGGLVLLVLTGVALNVSSMMGLVLLVGLVVKNGVLLIEQAQSRIDRRQPPRLALRAAARRRVRPIMLTTLCTLFGLVPLALSLGSGSELQRPLALVVIGGLIFSTVASLVLLPALAARYLRPIAD